MADPRNYNLYEPVLEGGKYKIKMAFIEAPAAKLDDYLDWVSPLSNGARVAVGTREDAIQLAGAVLLCAYYGKDFSSLSFWNMYPDEIRGKLTNPPYAADWDSISAYQRDPKQAISHTDPSFCPDCIEVSQAGIYEAGTQNLRHSGNPTEVVRTYEVSYKQKQFDALWAQNDFETYENPSRMAVGALKLPMAPDFGIEDFSAGTGSNIRAEMLRFSSLSDFEEKMGTIVKVLKYYQRIQDESYLILSDELGQVDFSALAEELEEYKALMMAYLKMNIEAFYAPDATNRNEAIEIWSYIDAKAWKLTGHWGGYRYNTTPARLVGTEESFFIKNIIRQAARVKDAATPSPTPDHPKEVAKLQKLYTDLIESMNLSYLPKTWALPHDLPNLDMMHASETKNPEYYELLWDHDMSQFDQLEGLLGNSQPGGGDVRLYHPNIPLTRLATLANVLVPMMTPPQIAPEVVLLLTNFEELLAIGDKLRDASDPCSSSFLKMLRATQMVAGAVAKGKSAAAIQKESQTTQTANRKQTEPPDLIVFAKSYVEYPQNANGDYIMPRRLTAMSEAHVVPPSPTELALDYRGITAEINSDLTTEEQLKLFDIKRNKPQKPKEKQEITQTTTLNYIKRAARASDVSGVSLLDADGDFSPSLDIRTAMARRNQTFADQIGDEIFRLTPRTPSKIRTLDDAYSFFLSKIDLSTIAREAMKCTFMNTSLEELIDMMCDTLLEAFFAGFGTNPDEVVKAIDKIRYGQYHVSGKGMALDFTPEIQAQFESIITQFKEWSVEQNTKTTKIITGETEGVADPLLQVPEPAGQATGHSWSTGTGAQPPAIGSASFYSTISDGLGRDTKRVLCELLIAGTAAAITYLVDLIASEKKDFREKKLAPTPPTARGLQACPDLLAFDLPDRFPIFSKLLGSITSQLEKIILSYVEQIIIVPLRNALIDIISSCGSKKQPLGQTSAEDLGIDFPAMDFGTAEGALSQYVSDVLAQLTATDVCALLGGAPTQDALLICESVLVNADYATPHVHAILSTKTKKITFFKKIGDASPRAVIVCQNLMEIQGVVDVCGDYDAATEMLRRTLKNLGLSDSQIEGQLNLEAKLNRKNFKSLLNAIGGNPNNMISTQEVKEVIADAAPQGVTNSAINQIVDPINENLKTYDLEKTKEGFSMLKIAEYRDTGWENAPSALPQANAGEGRMLVAAETIPSLPTEAELQKEPESDSDEIESSLGEGHQGVPDEAGIGTSATSGMITFPYFNLTDNEFSLGDPATPFFKFAAPNLLINVGDFKQFFMNALDEDLLENMSLVDFDFEEHAEWLKLVNNLDSYIFNDLVQKARASDFSKLATINEMVYSDKYLDPQKVKKLIQQISKDNFKNASFGSQSTSHLYDAALEGVILLYSRLFMVQMIMTAPFLFESASPQKVLASKMVREYIRLVLYPDLGKYYDNLKRVLQDMSEVYLKSTDINKNYEAALQGLDELAAVLFDRIETLICDDPDQENIAIPFSFEDVTKTFEFTDAGDALLYSDILERNKFSFVFETFASLSGTAYETAFASPEPHLTEEQAEDLQDLGQVADSKGVDHNGWYNAPDRILSWKELQDVYQIMYNGTELQTIQRSLIPMGYYVLNEQDAKYELLNDGVKPWTSPMYYNPNYQLYKYLMGFIGFKYFGTYIRQFITKWPGKPWADPTTIAYSGDTTSPLDDVNMLNFLFKVDDEFFPKINSELDEAIREIKINAAMNMDSDKYPVPTTTDKCMNLQQFKIGANGASFIFVNDGNAPDVEVPGNLLSSIQIKAFKRFFPNDWLKPWSVPAGGLKYAVKKEKIKNMFFPYNFGQPDKWNKATQGIPDSGDAWEVDGIPFASISPKLDKTMRPTHNTKTNPIFVRHWQNNTVNQWVTDDLVEVEFAGELQPDKADGLPEQRPGTLGRMLGKFEFIRKRAAGGAYIKTSEFDEKSEMKAIQLGTGRMQMKLPTKKQFIKLYNEVQEKYNELYRELQDENENLANALVVDEDTNEVLDPPTTAPQSDLKVPRNILKLEENPQEGLIAVDPENPDKKYKLFFERVNVRIPIRTFNIKGKTEWGLFDDDYYTDINGIRYWDTDESNMGFIDTKLIPIVRVYYVEDVGENYLQGGVSASETAGLADGGSTQYYTTPLALQSMLPLGLIDEDTQASDILHGLKYGLRMSLVLDSDDLPDGLNDGLGDLFKKWIGVAETPSRGFIGKKYYNRMEHPNSLIMTDEPGTFADHYNAPTGPTPQDLTAFQGSAGQPDLDRTAYTFPLLQKEISLQEMQDPEFILNIAKSTKLKDILTYFPVHMDQQLKNLLLHPENQQGFPSFFDIENLGGDQIARHLYCEMMKSDEAKDLFTKALKITNFLSVIAVYCNSLMEYKLLTYGEDELFSTLKAYLNNTVCLLLNQKEKEKE